jgi:uncharacterized membrane protein YkoI
MRKLNVWLGIAALMTGLSIVPVAILSTARAADEKKDAKIEPDKLPAKITESINGRFPGGKVTSAEKEVEDGNVVFDIELKHDGRKYEMDIKEDGTILEIEKEVFSKDVPAAVSKAVSDKYPKGEVKEVMEVNLVKGKEEKPDHYEVTLTLDGKEKEVIVALDGSSVKEEAPEPKEKK